VGSRALWASLWSRSLFPSPPSSSLDFSPVSGYSSALSSPMTILHAPHPALLVNVRDLAELFTRPTGLALCGTAVDPTQGTRQSRS
jgi:hypothetical protein